MENQNAGNYAYDAIGNLTQDVQAGISSILWNPYGKVQQVTKGSGNVLFDYDATGNRVRKQAAEVTYYVRDASGNVLAVYQVSGGTVRLTEQPVYGSARVGQRQVDLAVGAAPAATEVYTRRLGDRRYELSDHLSNVRVTVSDRKKVVGSYYEPVVQYSAAYYAFGQEMEGRLNQVGEDYRYGFNGKEKDKDGEWGLTSYDYGFRIYNPGIARFLSVDPLTKTYPMLTPYQFASNTPIWAIDLDGLEAATINEGVKTLVITIQGYKPARDTELNKTQAQNHRGASIDYDGLSHIAESSKNDLSIQVVVFSSSQNSFTKRDVTTTIENFQKQNSEGKVILIGHSLGADNAVEIVNENPNIKVDLLITLDIFARWDSDNISSNVKKAINFRRPGGEDIEIDNPKKTQSMDIVSPNSIHTSIDDDLSKVVSDIVLKEHSGAKTSVLFKTAKEGVRSVPKKSN